MPQQNWPQDAGFVLGFGFVAKHFFHLFIVGRPRTHVILRLANLHFENRKVRLILVRLQKRSGTPSITVPSNAHQCTSGLGF